MLVTFWLVTNSCILKNYWGRAGGNARCNFLFWAAKNENLIMYVQFTAATTYILLVTPNKIRKMDGD